MGNDMRVNEIEQKSTTKGGVVVYWLSDSNTGRKAAWHAAWKESRGHTCMKIDG